MKDQDPKREPRWEAPGPDVQDSPNGRLRVERFVGVWSGDDQVGRWSRLTDLSNGAVLLETEDLLRSEFRWQEDGALLLWMDFRQAGAGEGMFRLDPETFTFRNLANAGPAQPLSMLAEEVEAERKRILSRMDEGLPRYTDRERRFAADGSFRIDFDVGETGHGAPVRRARIVLPKTGEVVLDLTNRWPVHEEFFRGNVILRFDKMWLDAAIEVAPERRIARLYPYGKWQSTTQIVRELDHKYHHRSGTDAAPVAPEEKGERFELVFVNRAERYALERDRETGKPIFSIPVSSSYVEYDEYYDISEDEFRQLLFDDEAAKAFAARCGRRELDDRLILKPGWNRGSYS